MVNATALDEINTKACNEADVIKWLDSKNEFIIWPDDGTNSLKRSIFLDGFVKALN